MTAAASPPAAPTAELELAHLCTGTAARRGATAPRIRQLGAAVDWDELTALLRDNRLLPLLGPRLLELPGVEPGERLAAAVSESLAAGRHQAMLLQTVADLVAAELDQRGIAATPLKGPSLSEAVYGDPGRRQSSDVDLLVAAEHLGEAVAVARGLGYGPPSDRVDRRGLPLLHFSLVHERGELPPLELHWRIHWYDTRFAAERLLPPEGAATDWRPGPVDELAALLLYYGRDGFVGLRQATDLGAWWDRHGERVEAGALAALAARYPRLHPVLSTSARMATLAVGLPAAARLEPPARGRLAIDLARRAPLLRSQEQLFAQIGLIDGLLSPRRGRRAFLRRQIAPPREVIEGRARKNGRQGRPPTPAGFAVRTLFRYGLTLATLLRPRQALA
ncbi:MAG: nucleotidyltransferase family protein [Solirubrobacterales bacterium]